MSLTFREVPISMLSVLYGELQTAQLAAIERCNELLKNRKEFACGLGAFITRWRELTHNRQQDLAKILGVPTPQVSQAERGRRSSVLQIIQLMIEKKLVVGNYDTMEIPQEFYRKDQRVVRRDDGVVLLLPTDRGLSRSS